MAGHMTSNGTGAALSGGYAGLTQGGAPMEQASGYALSAMNQ
jgi:hypothetical protein